MTLRYDYTGDDCTSGSQPGTKALRKAALHRFPYLTDLGIYACRPVSGGSYLSTHGEGRGLDLGVSVKEKGDPVVAVLIGKADELSIQEIIWWGRRWTVQDFLWKPYNGPSPHKDHIHTAQNWDGASWLTDRQAAAAFALPPTLPPQEDDEMPVLVQVEDGPKAQSYYLLAGSRRRHIVDDPTLAELRNPWGAAGPAKTINGGKVSLRFLNSAYPPLESPRDD